jgi:predicted nucleic acid-binding protein
MFLLDTVIVSEIRKKQPDSGVIEWISRQPGSQLYLSVVTLGEIERGIERRRKTEPAFADTLAAWLESLTLIYADRILPITPAIARRWGRLSAQIGNDSADLLIAATGLTHHLAVVTRNVSHFEPTGITVVNPFSKA